MRWSITEGQGRLDVRIEDVPRGEQDTLDKIRTCRATAWACPSGECMNIAAIDERIERGTVLLTLTPRNGRTLARAGIAECLRYMLGQAAEA